MNRRHYGVIVIGAGAAGLMAAVSAARAMKDSGNAAGASGILVLEKNEKAGKKIYITGKGRCNFTNACETRDFFGNVVRNPKFLYSALNRFDQSAVIDFFESAGCPTKIERGNRAFPVSDHASDITRAFTDTLKSLGVGIRYHCEVRSILEEAEDAAGIECGNKHERIERRVIGVELATGERLYADSVILCTGGLSYPATGSTGDGHRMARELGLNVTPCAPSLVPLETEDEWPKRLQGLSLKNVAVELWERPAHSRKPLYSGFGEMLFTHFGLSGPLILSASAYLPETGQPCELHLDCKPAMTRDEIVSRLEREFSAAPFKHLETALRSFFPARLAQEMAVLSGISLDRMVRSITAAEREKLADLIKCVVIPIRGTRGFPEAIVTRGGIDVRQMNPSTMEVRGIRGLYVAGEVLDVDALTGGFNLQIAWSTGHMAGQMAGQQAVGQAERRLSG